MTDNDVYWNDLKPLKDLFDNLTVNENKPSKKEIEKEIEDFKESIQYFIHDIVMANILLYKEYEFDKKIKELTTNNIWEIIKFSKSTYIVNKNIEAWLCIARKI